MIKTLYLLLLISTFTFAHDHVPGHAPHDTDTELNFRYIKKLNPYSYITDLKFRKQYKDRNHFNYRAGYLKRIHKKFKFGGFVEIQTANRHDDDWIILNGDDWTWENSDERLEFLFTGDFTYRSRVLRRLVFELKNRLSFNAYNENTFLRLRPGLNYFILDKYNTPVWNILVQYEYYHPLNYGEATPYEQWFYLSGLYHQTSTFKWGPMLSYKSIRWDPSKEFKQMFPNEDYEVINTAVILGLNFLFVY